MYPVDVIAGDKDVITLSHGSYYPRSSSNAGGFTTTRSVRTAVSGAATRSRNYPVCVLRTNTLDGTPPAGHNNQLLCSFRAQLQLIPAYSSQSSSFEETLARVGLSEFE